MKTKSLLILGASSWIGHYLLQYINDHHPELPVIGTFGKTTPNQFSTQHQFVQASTPQQAINLISTARPGALLNLNRGESEEDYRLHLDLIDQTNRMDCHYYYASSFNACDANLLNPHPETEIAHAQSEYGKFKARCEAALIASSKRHGIFRFSGTHGWAPNRIARTEAFLQKLAAGEIVNVNRGILQNRTAVHDLAGMMVDLISLRGTGVFNLGSVAPSDEIDFLRSLSKAFGYSVDQVIADEDNPTNAFMIPQRLFELCGEKWRRTDEDTIRWVSLQPELQKYKSPSFSE